jgi:hypothetical protein
MPFEPGWDCERNDVTHRRLSKLLFRGLFALPGALLLNGAVAQDVSWTVKPSYETKLKDTDSTAFSIPDEAGVGHVFYNESHAILIIEGAYTNGWADVSDPAKANEKLLRERLEERGFHVLVWRNLAGSQLRTALTEAFSNYGYKPNARLFFYYYGHGLVMGENENDPTGPRTFIVPIDAPNPSTQEQQFYQKALPITQIVEFAKESKVKHAFFAFEACRAGSVIASLAGPPRPYPKGYLLNPKIQEPIDQFLTAGSAEQDIAATNSFTPLLIEALDQGDINKDGYVTGSEVIMWVTQYLPQTTKFQNPENGHYPLSSGGDFVFGPVVLNTPPPKLPTVTTREEVVNRQWRSPELQVDCNHTNSARLQAVISLDPNFSEAVQGVSARLENTSNIKDVTGPKVEGPIGPNVVVSYGFNGLDRNFLGNCPGGGHATLVVDFAVHRKVPVVGNAQ